jgi:chorismate lyase/3-hydroxybenzoate synthase
METLVSETLKNQYIRAFFGQAQTYCLTRENCIDLYLKIPIFGQQGTEEIIFQPGRVYQKLGFHIIETEDSLAGALIKEVNFPLEESVYKIYLDFLKLTQGWNLFRIWNYVPYINDETLALENYKSFCKGRSLAFETFYGQDFCVKMPAGSAVGINDNKLVLYFIAGKERGSYFENPQQVPAYHYPKQYGPRSPSFSRGTLIAKDGKQIGYVSGTASIKGHQSMAIGDVTEQLHITLDNISLVCEQMGLIERKSFSGVMPDPVKYNRSFKVYLRHEANASYICDLFSQIILSTQEEHIIFLQADICRSELDIEIEAIFHEK